MWNGADASYLAAITAGARSYTWHGTITDADGTSYSYTAGDIVKGSGQITRQISSPTSLDIGTVYTSQFTIRLYKSINRYKLYDGTIDLYCDVDVGGVTYSVPMGVYTISACTQENACISITAYDYMMKLDAVTVSTDQGQDTAYGWINYFCTLAGVTLATSQADIDAMPNGTEQLDFMECDTPLTSMTCRDALSYVCAAVCANAYIDRAGELVIQQYSMTATDDIAANERFSSSLSDFTTNYTAVTLGYYKDGVSEYYAEATDDGLTFDLGTNPFLQFSLANARLRVCMAIIDSLTTIEYEPFTATIQMRPELDPMDVLTFSGNQASSDKGAITQITYKIGGFMTVKCAGGNPRLSNAKSRETKTLNALASKISENDWYNYYFENSSAYSFKNTTTQIANIAVETVKETKLTMIFTVNFQCGSKGRYYLYFYINGTLFKTYHDAFLDGECISTVHLTFNISSAQVNYITVFMESEGYATFTIDGTWTGIVGYTWDTISELTWENVATSGTYSDSPPTITIPIGYSQLTIFGRGLAATEVWDGQIVVSDALTGGVYFDDLIDNMTDTAAATTYTPEPAALSDLIDLDILNFVDTLTDSVSLGGGLMLYNPYINTDNITTSGVTVSDGVWVGSGEIDDGTNGYIIIGDEIYTSGISTITANDNGGYWQLSFDSGATWEGYSGGAWSTDTIMTTAQLSALTNADLTAKGASLQIKVLLEASCNATSVTVEGGTV